MILSLIRDNTSAGPTTRCTIDNITQLAEKLDAIYKLTHICLSQLDVSETNDAISSQIKPIHFAVKELITSCGSHVRSCNTNYKTYLVDKNVEILELITDEINIEIIFNNSVNVSDINGACVMQNAKKLSLSRRNYAKQLIIEKIPQH